LEAAEAADPKPGLSRIVTQILPSGVSRVGVQEFTLKTLSQLKDLLADGKLRRYKLVVYPDGSKILRVCWVDKKDDQERPMYHNRMIGVKLLRAKHGYPEVVEIEGADAADGFIWMDGKGTIMANGGSRGMQTKDNEIWPSNLDPLFLEFEGFGLSLDKILATPCGLNVLRVFFEEAVVQINVDEMYETPHSQSSGWRNR